MTRPESAGDVLLILGDLKEAGNSVRGRRGATGEPGVVEVEGSPEELDRAALPDEHRPVPLEHGVGAHLNPPPPPDVLGVIGRVGLVHVAMKGVGHLARQGVDGNVDAECLAAPG
jgi:hypothetical protein